MSSCVWANIHLVATMAMINDESRCELRNKICEGLLEIRIASAKCRPIGALH